jgi:hypothetical protein
MVNHIMNLPFGHDSHLPFMVILLRCFEIAIRGLPHCERFIVQLPSKRIVIGRTVWDLAEARF